ncbi:hypothetical protein A3E39_02610 [Candidatus Uhrbacteria bacterium RIFCSPHIGHO2_12_FULL_60_25]|uniref:Serine protease n=1 Tax=Candidatus Uhrbacteria bacterium RIFCSPHIGHO2_12_FULL_60_25 TaxID=1802399 RepID=A0A1F7UJC9_9BACT|nr:MAG: hypothetical protein A3E39_02610 [Candidatus Uhrbacteria bacterium RIFCSPHIGHO2_12_FULL_60_25]
MLRFLPHSTWLEKHHGLNRPTQFVIAAFIASSVFVSLYSALAVTENEIFSAVQIIIFNADGKPITSGSGSIIDEDGNILTNHHVLEDAIENEGYYPMALLTTDPKKPPTVALTLKLIGYSKTFDLALVQFSKLQDKSGNWVDFSDFVAKNKLYVNHVKLDRFAEDEKIALGDTLQILGYPDAGGSSITYTKGIVSGFEQYQTASTSLPWLIKTDAKVNPGNSGGAAFDSDDNFIGVPEAVAGGPGNIGYIISLPVINDFLNMAIGAPSATSTSTDVTIIPAEINDAYCDANVRKNSVFNPGTGNCECKTDYVNLNNECVARVYFLGTPRSRADILNCKVVADTKMKRYWLRGHTAIETMSLKNKACVASEADAKKAKYQKVK